MIMELRQHPEVRDQWPPEAGGAFGKGFESPRGGEDVLEGVFYYAPVANAKADIALRTVFKGRVLTRDLLVTDAKFAEKLASRLKEHVGKSIAELAEIPIEF
jgi:hypothetical protein